MSEASLLRREGRDRAGRAYLIRPTGGEDAPALVAIRDAVAGERGLVAALPGERSEVEERLALASLVAAGGLGLTLEVEGAVAGQLSVARRRGPWEGHVGDLSVAIAVAHRDRGLGTAMVEVAIEWGRVVRLGKLCLAVFPSNRRAIAVYRACGFAEEGLQRGQVRVEGEARDILLMGLIL